MDEIIGIFKVQSDFALVVWFSIQFKKNDLTPLDMYNGSSHVCCIKPEG